MENIRLLIFFPSSSNYHIQKTALSLVFVCGLLGWEVDLMVHRPIKYESLSKTRTNILCFERMTQQTLVTFISLFKSSYNYWLYQKMNVAYNVLVIIHYTYVAFPLPSDAGLSVTITTGITKHFSVKQFTARTSWNTFCIYCVDIWGHVTSSLQGKTVFS